MARRKARKQHVVFRFKQREQLKRRVRYVFVRSVAVALVIGFGVGLVTGGDSFVSRFIGRHNPRVDVRSPGPLEGQPMRAELPKNTFWLWFPGSALWLQKKICRKYPAVRAVHLEKSYDKNYLTVRLEPRIPLVSWNGEGFDKDGTLFAITPETRGGLPSVSFPATANKRDVSRWLSRLASLRELWPDVSSIRQNPSESLELKLKSGTLVLWGPLDVDPLSRKGPMLARVLDDAHKNMGGAARADLRFFDQGRIIVLPKTVVRK